MKRNENTAKRKKIKTALFAAVLTVFLPVGIVFIILGAGNGWIMLVAGIIMTVLGFYGSPMAWIKFGEATRYERLSLAIYRDKLLRLSDIASQIRAKDDEAENLIKTAIEKRIIEGFIFDDAKKELKPLAAFSGEREIVVKCPSCGATAKVKESDPRCPYCGSAVKIVR